MKERSLTVTSLIPISEIEVFLPLKLEKILEKTGKKDEELSLIRKGLVPTHTKLEEDERATVDYITTKDLDRDNEIVVPEGGVLRHYLKNPVVLWAHNYSQLPIGKSLWIKSDDKGLISKTQYARHDFAEKVYSYRKDGYPLAKSIGFIPTDWIYGEDLTKEQARELNLNYSEARKAFAIYTKWILLEYSDVPVPANPEALELAKSKGLVVPSRTNIKSEDPIDTTTIVDPKIIAIDKLIFERLDRIEANLKTLAKYMKVNLKCLKAVLDEAKKATEEEKITAEEIKSMLRTELKLTKSTKSDISMSDIAEAIKRGKVMLN